MQKNDTVEIKQQEIIKNQSSEQTSAITSTFAKISIKS